MTEHCDGSNPAKIGKAWLITPDGEKIDIDTMKTDVEEVEEGYKITFRQGTSTDRLQGKFMTDFPTGEEETKAAEEFDWSSAELVSEEKYIPFGFTEPVGIRTLHKDKYGRWYFCQGVDRGFKFHTKPADYHIYKPSRFKRFIQTVKKYLGI